VLLGTIYDTSLDIYTVRQSVSKEKGCYFLVTWAQYNSTAELNVVAYKKLSVHLL